MVYVVKLGSLVPTGPDGAAVGWPAAVDGSAAVIRVTRVPIAGPRPSTGPWPLAGLAKPVMAQLIFQGSRQSVPELDRGVTPNLAMPFWRASAQQRGHAKPGDALLACQRLTGGGRPKLGDELWRTLASAPHGSCAKPSDALWRPALNRGLHQARQCPSNGPVLNRGVALSPVILFKVLISNINLVDIRYSISSVNLVDIRYSNVKICQSDIQIQCQK